MNKINTNTQALDKLNQIFSNILLSHIASGFSNNWLNIHGGQVLSVNASTGKVYSWINQLILDHKCNMENRDSKLWLTLNQAESLGATLKSPFEKPGTSCFFSFRHLDAHTGQDISGIVKSRLKMGLSIAHVKYVNHPNVELFELYNARQFVNLPAVFFHSDNILVLSVEEKLKAVKRFILLSGITSLEKVNESLTAADQLEGHLHSLSRWSINKACPRQLSFEGVEDHYTKVLYSQLFAAFLAARLGFTVPIIQDSTTIEGWLDALIHCPEFFVKSIAYARKSVSYCLYRLENGKNSMNYLFSKN